MQCFTHKGSKTKQWDSFTRIRDNSRQGSELSGFYYAMNTFLWQNLELSKNYLSDLQKHFDAVIIPQFQNISNRLALIDAQTNVNAVLASFKSFHFITTSARGRFWASTIFHFTWYIKSRHMAPGHVYGYSKITVTTSHAIFTSWLVLPTYTNCPACSDPEQIIRTAKYAAGVKCYINRQCSITTAPVPLGKKSVQLVLPSVLGLNTDHQTVIQPTLCIGNKIQVCDNILLVLSHHARLSIAWVSSRLLCSESKYL